MIRVSLLNCLFTILSINGMVLAQEQDTVSHTRHGKKWLLGSVQAGFWGGSFYTLNKAWYENYPRSTFHLYNDGTEWLQMDKAGHVWSAYHLSRLSGSLWKAAGTKHNNAAIIGSITGMGYMSVIEILDGYSDKWGFSLYDVFSNTVGSAAYLLQELRWREQKIIFKLSYWPVDYDALQSRANGLFGNSGAERLLKDYNGQTYWASINPKIFFPGYKGPQWLNIAIGYGARTMLGGYENSWIDANGSVVNRNDITRYRRFYLSLDVDLSRIKTNNKFLKTVFSAANVLKIPAPAIELNTKGSFRFHPVFY